MLSKTLSVQALTIIIEIMIILGTLCSLVWRGHWDIWVLVHLCFVAQERRQFCICGSSVFSPDTCPPSTGHNQGPEGLRWRDVVSSVIQITSSRKLPDLTKQLPCFLICTQNSKEALPPEPGGPCSFQCVPLSSLPNGVHWSQLYFCGILSTFVVSFDISHLLRRLLRWNPHCLEPHFISDETHIV